MSERILSDEVGLPLIVRPAFTLGGFGGDCLEQAEFEDIVTRDVASDRPSSIDQSVPAGRYELEVVRTARQLHHCGHRKHRRYGAHG